MLEHNNLLFFLLAILPPILYSFVIYINTPYKSISIKKALKFLGVGLFSATIAVTIQFIFPFWYARIGETPLLSYLIFCFFQIAFLEEISKYITFKIGEWGHKSPQMPIATMFYCCMASMGFATLENINYVSKFYFKAVLSFMDPDFVMWQIVKGRAITAVIAHMITGLFMGYFIALGRLSTPLGESRSYLNVFLKRHTKIKRFIFTVIGIITAMIFHGLYDFNLMYPNNPFVLEGLIIILLSGLIISYYMAKRLSKITIKNLENQTY